jgi:hypothetical protein
MRYGDSLSSLSLASSCTGGSSLFYLRLGGLTFLGSRYSCALSALIQMWANITGTSMRDEGCSVSFSLHPESQSTTTKNSANLWGNYDENLWWNLWQKPMMKLWWNCCEDCFKRFTVELLTMDPPRSGGHPLYNGQLLWNGLNLP